MFSNHPDPMRMEPTPERVFAVCKMVERQSMSKEDLVSTMALGHDSPDIGRAINVALEELHVLSLKDGKLKLVVSEDVLKSPASFRKYVSSKVFLNRESTFFLFTRWLIDQNERIFGLGKWETLATTARSESASLAGMNENAVLGWRFWAAFLGIGYLNGTMIIPNMKIRIQDVLATEFSSQFSFDTDIRARDFFDWLEAKMPEVVFHQEHLPLALSAGLRTLHALELISLHTQRDTEVVKLYGVDGDPINSFSHILVREEVCK